MGLIPPIPPYTGTFEMKQQPAEVVLDESKYGYGLLGEWKWAFFGERDDEGSLITVTESNEPVLTAVTTKQYKAWSKQKIVAIKRPWYVILDNQIKKVVKFLGRNHCSISRIKSYIYVRFFNHYLIISRYGIRLVTPSDGGFVKAMQTYYLVSMRYKIVANRQALDWSIKAKEIKKEKAEKDAREKKKLKEKLSKVDKNKAK